MFIYLHTTTSVATNLCSRKVHLLI